MIPLINHNHDHFSISSLFYDLNFFIDQEKMACFHLDPSHSHRINNTFDLKILTCEHQVKKVTGCCKDNTMSRYFSFLDHKDHVTQCFLIKREKEIKSKGAHCLRFWFGKHIKQVLVKCFISISYLNLFIFPVQNLFIIRPIEEGLTECCHEFSVPKSGTELPNS